MDYTTLQVVRVKDLSESYFEVILQNRNIIFKPGDCLNVIDTASDNCRPFFISSGIQEPWLRLLIKRSSAGVMIDYLYNLKKKSKIRIGNEPFSIFPGLIYTKRPVFLAESIGLHPFLSYFSTYPGKKIEKMVYVHHNKPVNLPWLKSNTPLIEAKEIGCILDRIPINRKSEYYICGSGDSVQAFKQHIIQEGVSEKKIYDFAFAY